eukprot:CAMPEP_0181507182 /NCGR_PEP_ID=MMETSP1110-20121109/59006_1 /TAXON_ID=174948 /ORGANISM="Symbiodinium sp., Strain CCMP421" /LENGTH=278 /DNA_ID=CAMNT_0023636319 /DNA_START=38 /DNA_END=875 /DNA_ORIENTATION=-
MATGCNGTSSKRKLEVLDQDAFLQKSKAARLRRSPEGHFIKAMYSSLVDSIITDPEMMVIPLDDHSIVRGHAVFDTCTLADGKVYRLGIHLDRLFKSAKLAKLKLPFGDSEEENRSRITDIVCQTCVASGLKDAGVRFFLTAGPGNFGFTTAGCEPAFYVSVLTAEKVAEAKGIGEALVPETEVPMKPALLATLKSNNYLLNETEALKEVRQEILHKDQLFAAQEVIMFCGDLGVFPVTTLDGCTIASGEVGPVGKELKRLIWQVAFEGTEEHIQLTY